MKIARVDDNQKAITKFLREKNVTVTLTSTMGRGFPDMICGYKGQNVLLEVKDGSKPLSAQTLTPDQRIWHHAWHGQVAVINSPEAAWLEILRCTKE